MFSQSQQEMMFLILATLNQVENPLALLGSLGIVLKLLEGYSVKEKSVKISTYPT